MKEQLGQSSPNKEVSRLPVILRLGKSPVGRLLFVGATLGSAIAAACGGGEVSVPRGLNNGNVAQGQASEQPVPDENLIIQGRGTETAADMTEEQVTETPDAVETSTANTKVSRTPEVFTLTPEEIKRLSQEVNDKTSRIITILLEDGDSRAFAEIQTMYGPPEIIKREPPPISYFQECSVVFSRVGGFTPKDPMFDIRSGNYFFGKEIEVFYKNGDQGEFYVSFALVDGDLRLAALNFRNSLQC